ncbi:AAA domain-containing protein [uncultured Draconibacterium sp.]|uniref:DEAD/DEAH box helicase n=1 Tax=uncultured Draconibacterium sp. TaxID=1573823 RepID=UPI003217B254
MKKVTNDYNLYFERHGRKVRIIPEKIYQEHPWVWSGEKSKTKNFNIDEIISAVKDEIRETRKVENESFVFIKNITVISNQQGVWIYTADIIIEDDNIISLNEGQQVKLYERANLFKNITILNFNTKEETLAFQCDTSITGTSAKIQSSSVFLLYKLHDALENISPDDKPIWNLIKKKQFPNQVEFAQKNYNENLDESQVQSLDQCLKNDITYIWGPPGTGKSHTLARIGLNLYNANETTVVCAIANVAVDGLVEKTIDLLKEYQQEKKQNLLTERKIIRLGYAQSEKVRNIPEIKFENQILIQLAAQISNIETLIHKKENSKTEFPGKQKELLQLRSKKDNLKKSYDEVLKKYIAESRLIFLTASKFTATETLKSLEIDNLIIDEGSMMSIPYLLVLAAKVKKRVIICGDPLQLSPIALSASANSKKWLHPDLFSLIGNKKKLNLSKAVTMLKYQRRTAAPIANLINESFYDNQLITLPQNHHNYGINVAPSPGHISFVNLPRNSENRVEHSKSRSKYNKLAREETIKLVIKIILENEGKIKSIGIIAPYRQQIIDYKRDLEIIKKEFPDLISIKPGTIHTFQGSECDVIIWDIVDAYNESVGILYKGERGERLVNVAISRAKSKLIIVGHNRFFHECIGRDTVSHEIQKLMSHAWESFHHSKN